MLNSTVEELEQSVKFVQSEQEGQQNDIIDVVLEPYLLTLNLFYSLLYCFDCCFEHVAPAGNVQTFFIVAIK